MVALLGATLVGAAAIAAPPYYRVEIDAPAPLRKILETYLDLARYQSREDIGEDQLKFMLATASAQVTDLVSTEGYFTPHTSIAAQDDGKGKLVRITVDPGPRTIVSAADIGVTGAVAGEDPQRIAAIRSSWSLPPGQAFRQEDWDAAKDQGLQTLQKSRYAAARLADSQARIDPERHDAQLSANYDSGPAFTLGELQISGTRRYPAQIIRNVNPLSPGESYSAERLLALQRQIQSTPYFSNAIVSIDDDPAHPDMTPVKVQVSEFPAQRIRTGVGYSTDTGAQVEGRYSHYNVFNRAWTFDSQVKLEQQRQYGMLELAMPPDSKSFVNSVNTSRDRTTLEGVDLRSFRVGVKRARSREFYDTAYTLDYYSDQLQQENGATLPPDTVTAPGIHHALVPGFSWARRDVDNAIFPRQGHLLSLQAGFALKGLLTDQTFTRLDVRYRRYVPVGKRDLMIFRTEGGAVFTKGSSTQVPASLLFRAGGSDSVRGYDYQSIGNEKNGTVFPNKYLLTGSAEYQHWFNQQWGAAVFYDIGTTADNWSNKQFFTGTGVGARWRSPVGVVNADLAYGVQRQQFRPHISLGIAF
ncbi:outer membrane protein assembly factor [Oxalobacteraceae bacterium CAVE-383]|nr:outer membrane protein assembly factor [Oxalobacteraceae bacterium CAVE-383]